MQRYSRTDEIIGTSAFKTVYLAFDCKRAKRVAWSTIELQSSGFTLDLTASLQLVSRIEHDHVVRIHDWWVDSTNTTCHVITELFRPGNLSDFLKQTDKIDETVFKQWGSDLLTAIAYVKSLTIPLHVSLRLSNVLCHQDVGVVKLDLLSISPIARAHGLSRERLEDTRLASPEALLGQIDNKADIYALGLLFLEAVTKVQPYSECNSFASFYNKLSQHRPPDVLRNVADPGLREVIRKCLRRSDERPSAQELLNLPYFSFEPSLYNMHLVVIDDDPVNLRVCSRMLEREGVTMVPCRSFEEVAKLLSTRAFTGVITDIQMPDINGFDLCKRLRKMGFKSLVIIGVSAYNMDDVAERIHQSGMDGFLEKPFTFQSIQLEFRRARLRRTSSALDATDQ